VRAPGASTPLVQRKRPFVLRKRPFGAVSAPDERFRANLALDPDPGP
jgi:hypothetical protein